MPEKCHYHNRHARSEWRQHSAGSNGGLETINLLLGFGDQPRYTDIRMVLVGPLSITNMPSQRTEDTQSFPPSSDNQKISPKSPAEYLKMDLNQSPSEPSPIQDTKNYPPNEYTIPIHQLLPLFKIAQLHVSQTKHPYNSTNINPTLF